MSPARQLVLSFFGLCFIGGLGFLAPGMTTAPLTILEAFFTSTSAVCVTGLTVIDISHDLTLNGQIWLLFLIQLGGWGILTLSLFFASAFRGDFSMSYLHLGENFHYNLGLLRHIALRVVWGTLIIEIIGAVCLTILWWNLYGSISIWYAIFHSVSAFCNAGFSLFPNSLVGQENSVLLLISILVIFGGLGFLVLAECWNVIKRSFYWEKVKVRFSLHSSIVIWMTLLLLIAGTLTIWLLERQYSLNHLSLSDQFIQSFFWSTTARTAGFNAMPMSSLGNASLMVIMGLMMIGASPGSTGGGMKTTSFALLGLVIWARLRGFSQAIVRHRRIDESLRQKTMVLVLLGSSLTFVGTLGYLILNKPTRSFQFLFIFIRSHFSTRNRWFKPGTYHEP